MRIWIIVFLASVVMNAQATDTVASAVDADSVQAAPAAPLKLAGGTDQWSRYNEIIRGAGGFCGDSVCSGDIPIQGEDCGSCPQDCASGPGSACGDGICSTADGENCLNCPTDCNGMQRGNPNNRFCCGNGAGESPVDCTDSRCTSSGFSCSNDPFTPWCCGDGVCEFMEDCTVDGLSAEVCTGGVDEDCDAAIDCADTDCEGDPACVCVTRRGAPCDSDSDCCSGKCRGKPGNMTCK